MKSKLISILIVLSMTVSFLPSSVSAYASGAYAPEAADTSWEEGAVVGEEDIGNPNAEVEDVNQYLLDFELQMQEEEEKEANPPEEGDTYVSTLASGERETGIPIDEEYIRSYLDKGPYSDEDFYGQYDQATGKWLKKGKLNYSYDSGMEEVGLAVMEANGDYTEVKERYLEYNRNKVLSQDRNPIGDNSKMEKLKADLMLDGHVGQYTLVDVMPVSENFAQVELDITSQVQALRGKNSKYLLEFISRLKDGSRIEIASKDNDDPSLIPVITIVTNGVPKSYPAIADTTIRAGSRKTDTSGGKDGNLYACESESSIGLYEMVDANTERAMIQFDLSDLVSGQNITSAQLQLYAQNIGTEGSYGELVVYDVANGAFTENFHWNSFKHRVFSNYGEQGINWNAPSAANSESIGGSYREDFTNVVSSYAMSQYQYTGDERYAYVTIANMLSYLNGRGATRYDVSTLRCGVRGQEFHRYLYRLINSAYMTPEIFSHLIKYYYDQGYGLYLHWNDHVAGSNWGVTQTSGLYLVMANLPEITDYDLWKEKAEWRFDYLMDTSLYEDGSCSEVSMGYTSYSLNGFAITQEYADEINTQIPFTDHVIDGMVKLALYLIRMTGPNYVDPQQGNCYNYTGSYIKYMQRVHAIIKKADHLPEFAEEQKPYIAYVATDGKEGYPQPETSQIYPTGKKIMMRSGWGDDDLYLQTNVDGGVHQHGHADDLATNIFAYGRYLLIDPRYNNYNWDDPYRIFYNSTEGHNTVVVNNLTQKTNPFSFNASNIPPGGERGYIFDWESNNSYDFMKARTENFKKYPSGYGKGTNEGFNHQRSILFVKPDFWIVSDYVEPLEGTQSATKVNNYRQLWHVLPNANVSDEQLTVTDTTITARTNYDDVNMQMVIANDGTIDPVIKDGWYSEGGGNYAAKYFSFGKDQQGTASFDTLLRPENNSNAADITAEKLVLDNVEAEGATATRFMIDEQMNGDVTDVSYYIVHDAGQQAERRFGDYITDGTMAYVEKVNNQYSRFILQNATVLKEAVSGKILFQSKEPVSEISIEQNGSQISLYTGDKSANTFVGETEDDREWKTPREVKLDTLTFLAVNPVKAVTMNEVDQEHSTSGQYVYFAEEPVLTPEPGTPAPTTTPKPTKTPGTSHGGGGGGGGGTPSTPKPSSTPEVSESPQPSPTPELVGTPEPEVTPEPEITPEPTAKAELTEGMKQEVQGHWAEKEITQMVEDGIVKGVDEDSLGLKNPTTRAEFIVMLLRAAEIEPQTYQGAFEDVAPDDWYAGYLTAAKNLGILEGDGINANPTGIINREEMAKILAAVCEQKQIVPERVQTVIFTDIGELSSWAQKPVQAVVSLGLMNGVENDAFQPKGDALREQAIVVVYRLMELLKE